MPFQKLRSKLPWLMAGVRAILGPLVIDVQLTGWSSALLACAVLSVVTFVSRTAAAEPIRPATWVGGTISTIPSGATGEIDLAPVTLAFRADTGSVVTIPYSAIQHFHYKYELKHHLGVLPAIAVGLFAARQHRRLLTISYTEPESQTQQAAILETSKDGIALLLTVLRTRTTVCASQTSKPCGGAIQ